MEARAGAGVAASGRLREHRRLRSLAKHDQHVRRVDATVAEAGEHVQRFGDPYPGGHVEHRAGGMKRRMQRREPVGLRVDHGEPVPLEQVAMRGEQPIGRAEQHASGGEGRIEFLAEHVAVERQQASGERRAGARRLRGVVEKRFTARRVASQELGEQTRGNAGIGAGPTARAPSLRLEEADVGPHPVLVSTVGQGERFESLEGRPAAVVHPGGSRRVGEQSVDRAAVEGGGRGGGCGCGHGRGDHGSRITPPSPPSAVQSDGSSPRHIPSAVPSRAVR